MDQIGAFSILEEYEEEEDGQEREHWEGEVSAKVANQVEETGSHDGTETNAQAASHVSSLESNSPLIWNYLRNKRHNCGYGTPHSQALKCACGSTNKPKKEAMALRNELSQSIKQKSSAKEEKDELSGPSSSKTPIKRYGKE